jgi:hypothetical protein
VHHREFTDPDAIKMQEEERRRLLPSLQFCAVKTGFQVQQQQQQQQQQHCEWAIFFPRLTILFESCTNRREEGVKLG